MLVADVGNTHMKLGCMENGRLCRKLKLPINATEGATVHALKELISSQESADCLWHIASVVPAATKTMEHTILQLGLPAPHILTVANSQILPHRLQTPETTGIDRFLAARGAVERHGSASHGLVVIQAGTAVTIDAILPDRTFLGGFILPGPEMWLSTLTQAAQLPSLQAADIPWDPMSPPPGDSTRTAILHGAQAGLSGAVRSAIQAAMESLPPEPRIVLTGGWAEKLAPSLCQDNLILEDDLVFQGMYYACQG